MIDFYEYEELLRKENLQHHGIAGQKWGKTNGPPYPLDYDDHTTAEKKGDYRSKWYTDEEYKPLKNMTGNKKQDYKRVKSAYEKARYATAASKQISKEKEKADKKSNEYKKKDLAELEKLSKKEASKRQKELNEIGKEFASLYGDKKISKLTSESLANMSDSKAKKYVLKKGHETLATALTGEGSLIVSGVLKRSRNKSEYEAYKSELKGDTYGAEENRKSANRKNLALQGYVGYNAYKELTGKNKKNK